MLAHLKEKHLTVIPSVSFIAVNISACNAHIQLSSCWLGMTYRGFSSWPSAHPAQSFFRNAVAGHHLSSPRVAATPVQSPTGAISKSAASLPIRIRPVPPQPRASPLGCSASARPCPGGVGDGGWAGAAVPARLGRERAEQRPHQPPRHARLAAAAPPGADGLVGGHRRGGRAGDDARPARAGTGADQARAAQGGDMGKAARRGAQVGQQMGRWVGWAGAD